MLQTVFYDYSCPLVLFRLILAYEYRHSLSNHASMDVICNDVSHPIQRFSPENCCSLIRQKDGSSKNFPPHASGMLYGSTKLEGPNFFAFCHAAHSIPDMIPFWVKSHVGHDQEDDRIRK